MSHAEAFARDQRRWDDPDEPHPSSGEIAPGWIGFIRRIAVLGFATIGAIIGIAAALTLAPATLATVVLAATGGAIGGGIVGRLVFT
jgi:hypothetical protein